MNSVKLLSMRKKRSRNKYIVELHNDDFNTFEHVIQTLREVCGHNYFQATQCAHIVHNNGMCVVFEDKQELCIQIYNDLRDLGLTVKIKDV